MTLRLTLSHAEYEKLLHDAEKARKSVKVDKRVLQKLLIDNIKMHHALSLSNVKLQEDVNVGQG